MHRPFCSTWSDWFGASNLVLPCILFMHQKQERIHWKYLERSQGASKLKLVSWGPPTESRLHAPCFPACLVIFFTSVWKVAIGVSTSYSTYRCADQDCGFIISTAVISMCSIVSLVVTWACFWNSAWILWVNSQLHQIGHKNKFKTDWPRQFC